MAGLQNLGYAVRILRRPAFIAAAHRDGFTYAAFDELRRGPARRAATLDPVVVLRDE